MPIVSSSFSVDATPQRDGRRWFTERFIDGSGAEFTRPYLAPSNHVPDLPMLTSIMNTMLRDAEIAANVEMVKVDGRFANISLQESTGAQNASALREAYRNGTRVEAIMVGDFLASLTDTQLRNAFGLTAAQVTNLRTNKLTPAANAATVIRAATGA